MKLTQPDIMTIQFRRELPDELAYLADGKTPFISINSKAGGYLNPGLMDARDKIDLKRRIATMEAAEKDKAEYAGAMESIRRDTGNEIILAVYNHCVVDWETNIIDDDTGKPIEPIRDNFMVLARVRLPELVSIFTEFVNTVDKVAAYIRKVDEEAEKN